MNKNIVSILFAIPLFCIVLIAMCLCSLFVTLLSMKCALLFNILVVAALIGLFIIVYNFVIEEIL